VREYETLFIVQPEISEEGTAGLISKLDESLAARGALRLLCEDMGKRKLAYEIDKFHKGHYHVLRYLDTGAVVADVERILRLEESVLRFLTVVVDEDVVDVETRQARAKDEEAEQRKRAEERAAREAEEAAARAEAERLKEEQLASEAAAAAEAAKHSEAAQADAAAPEGEAEAAAPQADAAAPDGPEAAREATKEEEA